MYLLFLKLSQIKLLIYIQNHASCTLRWPLLFVRFIRLWKTLEFIIEAIVSHDGNSSSWRQADRIGDLCFVLESCGRHSTDNGTPWRGTFRKENHTNGSARLTGEYPSYCYRCHVIPERLVRSTDPFHFLQTKPHRYLARFLYLPFLQFLILVEYCKLHTPTAKLYKQRSYRSKDTGRHLYEAFEKKMASERKNLRTTLNATTTTFYLGKCER